MSRVRGVDADRRTSAAAAGAEPFSDPRTDPILIETSSDRRLTGFMPTVGLWAWTFIGLVASLVIIAAAVSAVNEIMLPLTFAAVLAIIFKPAAIALTRRRVRPTLAAGAVVLGLLALMTVVMVATVQGVVAQIGQIGDSVDAAAEQADGSLGVDQTTVDAVRSSVTSMSPALEGGFLTTLVSGVGSLVGLAEWPHPRGAHHVLPAQGRHPACAARSSREVDPGQQDGRRRLHRRHLPDPARATAAGRTRHVRDRGRRSSASPASCLASRWSSRSWWSTSSAGYIPYIGAFLGGGLAVIVALGDGGVPDAAVMLVVVLAANLLLENFVEPRGHGAHPRHPSRSSCSSSPPSVACVGGIVGLILAVPATLVAGNAIARLRRRGVMSEVADRAEPVVRRALD